jgi:hypothetical protein
VIPIDVGQRRSEATLGVRILTKVANIVNQNDEETVLNIICCSPTGGDLVND